MRAINKIILHCSASDLPGQDAALIDGWHKARGWTGIGYHWFIKSDGQLEGGRNEEKIGAHCEGANADSIGICLAGLSSFTDAQFTTLKRLLVEVRGRYPQATLHGHREFPSAIKQGKTCPVFDVDQFKQPKTVLSDKATTISSVIATNANQGDLPWNGNTSMTLLQKICLSLSKLFSR